MRIRKDGIFRSIDSKDFGIFQAKGWEKVIEKTLPKLEEVETKITEEPIIEEVVVEEQPIREVVQEEPIEEIEIPKSKRKKK